MNELKRKLALWLCPELGRELRASAEAHDNAQKRMITLHERLSDAELALAKAKQDRSIVEFQRDKANMQAHLAEDKSKALAKQLDCLKQKYKLLVRMLPQTTKSPYENLRITFRQIRLE